MSFKEFIDNDFFHDTPIGTIKSYFNDNPDDINRHIEFEFTNTTKYGDLLLSPLRIAVRRNFPLETIKYLVEIGADIYDDKFMDETIPHTAISEGNHNESVKYLLELYDYVDLNKKCKRGHTFIQMIFTHGYCVDILENVNYSSLNLSLITCDDFHQAVMTGYVENIRFLVENGYDLKAKYYHINHDNINGFNVLFSSLTTDNNIEITKYLVEDCCVDVNEKNVNGDTLLSLAKEYPNTKETIKFLNKFI